MIYILVSIPFIQHIFRDSLLHSMGEEEAHQLQLQIMGRENSFQITNETANSKRNYMWWIKVAVCSTFVLAGQSIGTILGRVYFDNGGNSKWMATLVQVAGFPIMFPFYFFISSPKKAIISNNLNQNPRLSILVVAPIYFGIGVLVAADCLLYSLGLLYLPVSTYSLICASQLAFNAFFSFFINAQKFTPYIINSLVLLTISSALLIFQQESTNSTENISKGKFTIGFLCTVLASAGYGLGLSLTQLFFQKVIKQGSLKIVLDMIIYPSMVASVAVLVGLFVSGEWETIKGEMEKFELGKVSYLMNLIWTTISWQVFTIGCVGLIAEVSALFSNVIGTLGLPIVPVLAVFIFHDSCNGLKVLAMVLAIWGFVSYAYQHYLDDHHHVTTKKDDNVNVTGDD